jgi:8-oxo-dGTP pyrophosphatase MutT (NUDIX family)
MKEVALALIRRGERWFLQRRHSGNPILPSLWEFPGGKAEGGEQPLETLARELREETGLVLHTARPWTVLEGSVRLHPFLVEADGDPRTDLGWGWFTVEEMRRLPLPPMNQALIETLSQDPQTTELRAGPSHLIG